MLTTNYVSATGTGLKQSTCQLPVIECNSNKPDKQGIFDHRSETVVEKSGFSNRIDIWDAKITRPWVQSCANYRLSVNRWKRDTQHSRLRYISLFNDYAIVIRSNRQWIIGQDKQTRSLIFISDPIADLIASTCEHGESRWIANYIVVRDGFKFDRNISTYFQTIIFFTYYSLLLNLKFLFLPSNLQSSIQPRSLLHSFCPILIISEFRIRIDMFLAQLVIRSIPSLPSSFELIFRAYLFEFAVSSIPSLTNSFEPIFRAYLFEFAVSSIPSLPSSFEPIFQVYLFKFMASSIPLLSYSSEPIFRTYLFEFAVSSIPSLSNSFESIFQLYLFEFAISSIPSLSNSFEPIFQLYLFEFAASSIPLLPSSFEPHRANISSVLARIRDQLDPIPIFITIEFIRTNISIILVRIRGQFYSITTEFI